MSYHNSIRKFLHIFFEGVNIRWTKLQMADGSTNPEESCLELYPNAKI